MKLIIAIVQDDDAPRLMDALVKEKIGATKLATTGGFLRKGNVTLMIGVENELVEHVMDLVSCFCKRRMESTAVISPMGGVDFLPMPLQVETGGAICFITDCEFRKI
ncbi:MAG: cyclic-di-AMP receptor [Christensenellales bacterium]